MLNSLIKFMGRRTPSAKHNQNSADKAEEGKSFDYNTYLDERLGKKKPKSSKNGTGTKLINRFFLVLAVIIILVASGLLSPKPTTPTMQDDIKAFEEYNNNSDSVNLISVTIYSSTTCSCCHQYVEYLTDLGFDIDFVKDDTKYLEVKDDFKIPNKQRSCHTTVIMGYFSEGHIPASVLYDIINDSPAIDGITLAGMPGGSPGMGGEKSEDWNIYSIVNGEITGTFAVI